MMVHIGDLAEHFGALHHFRTKIVAEPFRGLRLGTGLLFDLGHVLSLGLTLTCRRLAWCGRGGNVVVAIRMCVLRANHGKDRS